jgi:hypothetical protein
MEIELDVVVGGLAVMAFFIAILIRCFRSDND